MNEEAQGCQLADRPSTLRQPQNALRHHERRGARLMMLARHKKANQSRKNETCKGAKRSLENIAPGRQRAGVDRRMWRQQLPCSSAPRRRRRTKRRQRIPQNSTLLRNSKTFSTVRCCHFLSLADQTRCGVWCSAVSMSLYLTLLRLV